MIITILIILLLLDFSFIMIMKVRNTLSELKGVYRDEIFLNKIIYLSLILFGSVSLGLYSHIKNLNKTILKFEKQVREKSLEKSLVITETRYKVREVIKKVRDNGDIIKINELESELINKRLELDDLQNHFINNVKLLKTCEEKVELFAKVKNKIDRIEFSSK